MPYYSDNTPFWLAVAAAGLAALVAFSPKAHGQEAYDLSIGSCFTFEQMPGPSTFALMTGAEEFEPGHENDVIFTYPDGSQITMRPDHDAGEVCVVPNGFSL